MNSRLVPSLLIENRKLIKSKQFEFYRYMGDPVNAVRLFSEFGIDEIMIINKGAAYSGINFNDISRYVAMAFTPVTYAGGIKNLEDAKKVIACGVEKVSINNLLLHDVDEVKRIVRYLGASGVVASIDYRSDCSLDYCSLSQRHRLRGYEEFCTFVESLGVGEVVLNAIDRDGLRCGYDETVLKLREFLSIQLSVNCGCSDIYNAEEFMEKGINCVASSIFSIQKPLDAVLICDPR